MRQIRQNEVFLTSQQMLCQDAKVCMQRSAHRQIARSAWRPLEMRTQVASSRTPQAEVGRRVGTRAAFPSRSSRFPDSARTATTPATVRLELGNRARPCAVWLGEGPRVNYQSSGYRSGTRGLQRLRSYDSNWSAATSQTALGLAKLANALPEATMQG